MIDHNFILVVVGLPCTLVIRDPMIISSSIKAWTSWFWDKCSWPYHLLHRSSICFSPAPWPPLGSFEPFTSAYLYIFLLISTFNQKAFVHIFFPCFPPFRHTMSWHYHENCDPLSVNIIHRWFSKRKNFTNILAHATKVLNIPYYTWVFPKIH